MLFDSDVLEDHAEAVDDAYSKAVGAFEQRIADTDIADVFEEELQLDIPGELGDLQLRADQIANNISLEYFRQGIRMFAAVLTGLGDADSLE